MSYSRDKDAYTRGPGAIAAADYGNPRRARERRARIVRSERRDAQLARLTLGERGGMADLGAISTAGTVAGATNRRQPVFVEGGLIEGAGTSPMGRPRQPTGGKIPPRPQPLPPRPLPPVPAPTQPARFLTGVLPVVAPPARLWKGEPAVVAPPLPEKSTAVTRPRESRPIIVSGGGGGGTSSSKPPLPVMPPLPPPVALVPIDEEPAEPVAKPRNWLLIAAILGGAYLLLRDNDEKGTP